MAHASDCASRQDEVKYAGHATQLPRIAPHRRCIRLTACFVDVPAGTSFARLDGCISVFRNLKGVFMAGKSAKTTRKPARRGKKGNAHRPVVLIDLPEAELESLRVAPIFAATCNKACTSVTTLISKRVVPPHSGIGTPPVNIDGYRKLSAYLISDSLNSTTMRGFSLRLSFSLYPFAAGVGVVGAADCFFNFDTECESGVEQQRLNVLGTSDLKSNNGLPRLGGRDLAHILHTPVMGPYVSAMIMNEDSVARSAEVLLYLST